MTRARCMNEIWRKLGEPPELDPASDTQYSSGPLLGWVVNEGQRAVARWRDPQSGHQIRIRSLIAEMYFQSKAYSGALDAASTDTTHVVLPATLGTNDDQYNGWVFEHANQTRLIIDYTGSTKTATLHEALSATPASAESYKLYKNFWLLCPSTHAWVAEHISRPAVSDTTRAEGNLVELLKIVDLTNERELRKAPAAFYPMLNLLSPGDPGLWYRSGNKLVVDCPLDETLTFYAEYYREPTDVATDASEMELPSMFHWGIVLWGIWWGFKDGQDFQAAYAAKRDFDDFMRSVKTEYSVELERGESYGSLERG